MGVQEVARRLSYEQRELLILHVCGPQPIDHLTTAGRIQATRTTQALVARGFIRYGISGPTCPRPKVTSITELGHEAAAVVLGDCADMLARFGRDDELRPALVSSRELTEFRLLTTSASALTDG